jgi:hypothetical protein
MHINFSLEMLKVKYHLESLDLDREICYFKKYIIWGLDLIYLAGDREQWRSLKNTHSKTGEKLIKYLSVDMLLKNSTLWKGLAGQVYFGMGVNSEPEWGQDIKVLTTGSHMHLSLTNSLLVYLSEFKQDLHIMQHACACVHLLHGI